MRAVLPEKIKKRMQQLADELNHHDYCYYVLSRPEMSDREYDRLFKALQDLEQAHPKWVDPNSPTQRLPITLSEYLPKEKHKRPMLSLSNTYEESELQAFEERVTKILGHKPGYFCELKIDGTALELVYESGNLKSAITRGNGLEGENVTHNARMIRKIPLQLPKPLSLSVYGEIYFTKDQFAKVNRDRSKAGDAVFANPRNAASGTLRTLDARETMHRNLSFFAYDLNAPSLNMDTQANVVKTLAGLHFVTPPYSKVFQNAAAIHKHLPTFDTLRKKLDFEVDGVVIKVNGLSDQKILGTIARSPRWATAYKFEEQEATTQIESVIHQVGRTGKLTPVANVRAVDIGGVTVKRATLHNYEDVNEKDIRDGDWVFIKRAGDVIPAITAPIPAKRTGKEKRIQVPKTCPACQHAIVTFEGKADAYCINPQCPDQVVDKLIHFVSKSALDITHLSRKRIELFYKLKLIKSPEDIFKLKAQDLIHLEGFGAQSTQNLMAAIEKAKKVSLFRLLFGFAIPLVGLETSKFLMQEFGSLEKVMKASESELVAISGVGPEVARSVRKFFDNSDTQKWVGELLKLGIQIQVPTQKKVTGHFFSGKTAVITGNFDEYSRDQLKEQIENLGGKVSGSVSKKTDFVLVGADPGSKLAKAQKWGIRLIHEPELNKLLK